MGATALKAITVEAKVSAARVAVLEVTVEAKRLELAVGAIVYVVEAEVLVWRRMVELKTKDRGESKG